MKRIYSWILLSLLMSTLASAILYTPTTTDTCQKRYVINESTAHPITKTQYIIEIDGKTERYGNYSKFLTRKNSLNQSEYTSRTERYTRTIYNKYAVCDFEEGLSNIATIQGNDTLTINTDLKVHNIFTQSKTIKKEKDYNNDFIDRDKLEEKTTHPSYIAGKGLDIESRIVSLEGAFSIHMNCLINNQKYSDYRDCMTGDTTKKIEAIS
jgi:hypothetical protein